MLWPPGYHETICVKVLKMQLSSGQARVGFQSGGLIDTVELSWCRDWEREMQVWQWMHCSQPATEQTL